MDAPERSGERSKPAAISQGSLQPQTGSWRPNRLGNRPAGGRETASLAVPANKAGPLGCLAPHLQQEEEVCKADQRAC